ncbi:MAG: sigma-54 dependent transcriptional regulator [Bacteroidales bacterium]|jgi:DNA-binding NtrC family response regulator|nr:sigma-54 dependent transcriptional regulator [Bacteroidales bacterium]
MSRILVIDDQQAIRRTLREVLEYEKHTIDEAEDGEDGIKKIKEGDFDLVLCDIKMPRMDGMDVLNAVEGCGVPIVMISGNGDIETAVECMKKGSVDYIEKPLDLNKLLTTINNALAAKTYENQSKPYDNKTKFYENKIKPKKNETGLKEDEIIGNSPAIIAMKNLIDKIAATDAKVLITGENGSGKELVAQRLHNKSHRCNQPFVEINCAAIPNELIESELFGHEKGSFTSAIKQRKGKFEQADGGTLFLDEIGDMNLAAQSKVLRALQYQKITRVGSEKDISVNVRIIAATNRNLKEEIAKGNFREDLYHRLCVIEIHVPALNDRREDIPLLIDHFLTRISKENGTKRMLIEPNAVQALSKLDFSGNVRQLHNIIERLTILCEKKITLKDVEAYV